MSTVSSYCVKCGYRIDGDLQFCPHCGEPRGQGVPAAAQEPSYRWMEDAGGRPGEPHGAQAEATHARQHWGQPQPAQQRSPQPYSQPAQQYQQPYPQPYAQPAQHVIHHHQVVQQPGSAPSAAMGIGITAMCFMVMGLIPCLGWLNYFTIFLGIFSGTFGMICMFIPKFAGARGKLLIGMVLGLAACLVGFIRLVIGGGCL